MKVRNRYRSRNYSAALKRHVTLNKMRTQHLGVIEGARRLGMGLKGWLRKGSWRYQVIHYDINNPAMYFYDAVGMSVPARLVLKFVTVGSYDRMIGYLKLHVDPEKRYVEREDYAIDEGDVEDE